MELTALIRRDHDDLDRVLVAMLDVTTSATECASLLDAFRIGFSAHAEAQSTVFSTILRYGAPRTLEDSIASIIDEHRSQCGAMWALAALEPCAGTWLSLALEMRVALLDHADRDDIMRSSLIDHIPATSRRHLASVYATERLRRLGAAEPVRGQEYVQAWLFE